MKEEWKWIPDWEKLYMVSNKGRVRSVGREIPMPRGGIRNKPGHIMLPQKAHNNYLRIGLCRNGKRRFFSVHYLVLLAFVGPPPPGYECNHKNGDKANNRLDNLEWMTRSENMAHAFDTQLRAGRKGEANHFSRLTEAQVLSIRRLYAAGGESHRTLAARFNVAYSNVANIIHRRTWAHI